mmetsp:Transcript_25273/g.44168  ORF Transcript_25273/g.44168 Transcript_25273/m.44168 type:complete len:253 (+) Transcript_25273:98-856(+)
MKQSCRSAVAAFLLMASSSTSSVVRQTFRGPGAVDLSTEDSKWRASVATSLANIELAAPKESKDQAQKTKQSPRGPVRVQVDEKDMDKFVATLSPKCGTRFSDMMHGKGPELHSFGTADKASKASCAKLGGTLCETQAHVMQDQTANGRTMESAVDVKGDGCLPSECMSQDDLSHLAFFMHEKAEAAIPGMDKTVLLHVDCTANGGSKVLIGSGGYVGAPKAAGAPGHVHSAAGVLTLGTSVAACLLSLVFL